MAPSLPIQFWAKLKHTEKVVRQTQFPCQPKYALSACLEQVCHEFDIAVPLVLQKHERDLAQFNFTQFHASDFMEPFPYAALEVSLIFPKAEKQTR